MHCENTDVITGSSSRAFKELISDGAEFDFNMDDIARFRDEFKTLIENLSRLYVKAKSAEKQAMFDEKIQRQAAAAKGMASRERDDETPIIIKTDQSCGLIEGSDEESPVEIVHGLAVLLPIAVSNEKENRKDDEVLKDSTAMDGTCTIPSSDEDISKAVENSTERAARRTFTHPYEEIAHL